MLSIKDFLLSKCLTLVLFLRFDHTNPPYHNRNYEIHALKKNSDCLLRDDVV